MSCADSIAKLLADAHFSCYFSKALPSALDCEEPIVVGEGTFSRDSRMAEEERGSVVVTRAGGAGGHGRCGVRHRCRRAGGAQG